MRALAWLCMGMLAADAATAACDAGVAVQVLGSGGPIADDARASSGYLLWVDGHARALIDVGGGVFLRFGEAGARIEDLDAVVLTHLHTDHSADLPALLKGGYFSDRSRPLPLIGPAGAGDWPGAREFMQAEFAPGSGAYRYLAGFLDGSDGLFEVPVTEVPSSVGAATLAFANDRLRIRTLGVHHGPVPALGLTIEVADHKVAFSGDQSDDNPAFVALSRGAELMIVDHAIPQGAGAAARSLHLTPARIAAIASEAGVGRLVLSHLMRRSLDHLGESRELIAAGFDGELVVAEDLQCLQLGESGAGKDGGG